MCRFFFSTHVTNESLTCVVYVKRRLEGTLCLREVLIFSHLLLTETEKTEKGRAGDKDGPHKYSTPDTQCTKPCRNKLSQADRAGEPPLGLFHGTQSVSGIEAQKLTCLEKKVLSPSMAVISSGGEKMLDCNRHLSLGLKRTSPFQLGLLFQVDRFFSSAIEEPIFYQKMLTC